MTPKQAQRLSKKIAGIKRILAAEKRMFGSYDDSRGLRYLPTRYYIQLDDYKGGLSYTRWFAKSFPDDMGFPDFLFEWVLLLSKGGKVAEAKAKLAYLDDPKGSGLDYEMQEKHYSFWIHARQETKAKPSFGFQASAYQQKEHALVSLSQFAQQRETAHQQEQAQQLRLKQYQNRGRKLGGRGMS